MLMRFAAALLFKRSKHWLMPLFVVMFSVFLLFEQFAAFRSVRGEVDAFCREVEDVDLWISGDRLTLEMLSKVRKLPEVSLASFFYKGDIHAYVPYGEKQSCTLLGIDETTHLGLPNKVMYGSLRLKGLEDTAILSEECAKALFKLGTQKLRAGSALYLEENPMKIGGVVPVKKGFIVYTNLAKAKEIGMHGETLMVIKASSHVNMATLKSKIEKSIGLKAFTTKEFSNKLFQEHVQQNRTVSLFSMVVVFGLVLALGIFAATFYYFFKGQLAHYSVFKALGATPLFLTGLLVVQASVISFLGWGIALFLYSGLESFFSGSELFFALSWSILGITFGSLFLISLGTGFFVSLKVKETV